MKKLTFVASMAIAAVAFTSCGNGTPKADLKNDIDTVSYALGMAQTQGLKEYLVGSLGVDTAYIDEFVKGMNEGANAGDDKKKVAYYAGIQIGQQISNQMVKAINRQLFGEDSTQTISLKNFMAGFVTATTGKEGLMTIQQAQELANTKMQEIKTKAMEKEFGPNKEAGEKFLAENAKKEGVKTLPSGLQYKVIKEGTGAIPADTSMVKVHYEGKLIDGTVFDSSLKRGEPAEMYVNRVIKGWTEALTHMPVGSEWEVYIPQNLAYGEREAGQIKPFSALIFKIQLLEIKK
jgi:FKBP-type peptidyl-prolyl cis-trans isomerase FklB